MPYVLEKQKYNLTDEILRRLKIHKDFNELYDEIQKTDTNNQIVVEFLEDLQWWNMDENWLVSNANLFADSKEFMEKIKK